MLSKKQVACLQLLKAKKYKKKALKALLDDDSVQAISECCLNVLRGNLKLPKGKKEKLAKYKKEIRFLVHGKNKKRKKQVLIQSGQGILPWIIPGVLGIISSIFGNKDA